MRSGIKIFIGSFILCWACCYLWFGSNRVNGLTDIELRTAHIYIAIISMLVVFSINDLKDRRKKKRRPNKPAPVEMALSRPRNVGLNLGELADLILSRPDISGIAMSTRSGSFTHSFIGLDKDGWILCTVYYDDQTEEFVIIAHDRRHSNDSHKTTLA